ncbi:hypothetical protein AK830_g8396 [Neonectria ditissima]|uniref:Aminoglycoside phosphotransferase domain-containing protein n=1 Tax=Neonectria ditissima TaxID=78410 RepID=A0A0P7AUG8_9HYPO|nr:hypothetical protein AK830_g8396 [Neonectria ditissima]
MEKFHATRERIFAYGKFNLDNLLFLAAQLRGRPCTCDRSRKPNAGSLNWVIFIIFDDEIEWVFRSPRSGSSVILTDESASKMLISEASTLKYLGTYTSVPVPEVYSFNGSCDNDIGVPYILMSKAPGRVLSEYDWVEFHLRVPGYPLRRQLLSLTDRDREKIMNQLGTITSCLSMNHFDKIGSVFENSDGGYSIGECLSPSLIWQWRDQLEGIDRGPFHHESQYLNSLISAFISHAKELSLTPHSFFAPIPNPLEYPHWTNYHTAVRRWQIFCSIDGKDVEGSKNRLSYCIAGQFLYEMVPDLATGSFVLSHPDLHLSNIFVDDEFNVTCIIDWGSASSVPMTELLATPGFIGSVSPPTESLVAAFRAGFSQGGQKLDSKLWDKAEKMWHFSRLVRLLSTQDCTLFKALYELVYQKEAEEIPRQFYDRSTHEYSRELLVKLHQEELEDEKEAEPQEEVYPIEEPEEVAIARKLTVMSELNPNFVADKRLWRWIDKAVQLNENS